MAHVTYPDNALGRQRLKVKILVLIDNCIDFTVKTLGEEIMLYVNSADRHFILTKEELEKWPKK